MNKPLQLIDSMAAALEQRLEAWFAQPAGGNFGRVWSAAKVGLSTWAISFFLFSPALWTIFAPGRLEQSRAGNFLKLCHDPLARDLTEPILSYRITTPLMCWALHLPDWLSLLLPYLFTIGALGFVFHAVSLRTNRASGVLASLAVASSYAIIIPNTQPGTPDGVTHFAVAACLVFTSPAVLAGLTVFGTLNDERFLLAAPFILLWHAPRGAGWVGMARATWRQAAGFAVGVGIVLLVRHGLTAGWVGPGIEKPKVYSDMEGFFGNFVVWLREWWGVFLVNAIQGWRGAWLVFVAGVGCVAGERPSRPWVLLVVAGVGLATLSTTLVADVSRSIGYFFPAMLATLVAGWTARPQLMRRVLFVAVILSLLVPAFYMSDHGNIQWSRPLPLSILRWFTGWDVLDLFRNAA